MSYILSLSLQRHIESKEDGTAQAAALKLILGEDATLRMVEAKTLRSVPLFVEKFDGSTLERGRQEALATARTISQQATLYLQASEGLLAEAIALDPYTKTWAVAYGVMVDLLRAEFPGDPEKLAGFKALIREVLANQALKGISLK